MRDDAVVLTPESLWWLSTRLHQKGWTRLARLMKGVNYLTNRAILPPQASIHRDVSLWHRGLCVVINPNTHIGRRVQIGHGVTIAGTTNGGPTLIGDDVIIAAHAQILVRRGRPISIGAGAVIGAAAVVCDDVRPGAIVAGNPARETTGSIAKLTTRESTDAGAGLDPPR